METIETKYNDLGAVVRLSRFAPDGGVAEYHLMVTLTDTDASTTEQFQSIETAYQRVLGQIESDVVPVFKRYFLSDVVNQAALLPQNHDCAVSIIGQPPLNGTKVALWTYLQQGMTLIHKDYGIYSANHGHFRHLWFTTAGCRTKSSYNEAVEILGNYNNALTHEGCSLYDNCMRTWFFVHDIDNNYNGMVNGRNQIFELYGLSHDTHYIASTGIAGNNADPGTLVTFDAYAIDGLANGQIRYLHAPTHLNPTHEYGVAFERGTAIDYGDRRHVLISGTASINNRGEIEYPGDIVGQTGRMIENISMLLADADCTLDDITHAIVYLRDTSDYGIVHGLLSQRFPKLPIVITLAPVCRPGWLIEMECMAIKSITTGYPAL